MLDEWQDSEARAANRTSSQFWTDTLRSGPGGDRGGEPSCTSLTPSNMRQTLLTLRQAEQAFGSVCVCAGMHVSHY